MTKTAPFSPYLHTTVKDSRNSPSIFPSRALEDSLGLPNARKYRARNLLLGTFWRRANGYLVHQRGPYPLAHPRFVPAPAGSSTICSKNAFFPFCKSDDPGPRRKPFSSICCRSKSLDLFSGFGSPAQLLPLRFALMEKQPGRPSAGALSYPSDDFLECGKLAYYHAGDRAR